MKKHSLAPQLGTLALSLSMLVTIGGCASRNVNPPQAKPGTGYADFFIDTLVPLCWEVVTLDEEGRKLNTLFSDFGELDGNILRLALPPGPYRFRVSYWNRAIMTPAVLNADIRAGNITPIHILYQPAEAVQVRQSSETLKRSVRGVVRAQDVAFSTSMAFHLSADAESPTAYRPKEQMPYFLDQAPSMEDEGTPQP